MNKKTENAKSVQALINTSVSDCEISLSNISDPALLCDLLIECHVQGHGSRGQAVRRRISKLIKK